MTEATTSNPAKSRPHGKRPPQRTAQQPRAVNPILERLFELYPKMFGTHFLPLKLGTFQDLMARHPEKFKKDELKLAMGQHARSTRYLESVADGLARHDLTATRWSLLHPSTCTTPYLKFSGAGRRARKTIYVPN